MNEQETLVFETEEARETALNAIPDEPPQGANVSDWTVEQEQREQEILNAPLKGSEEAAAEPPPTVTPVEPPAEEELRQVSADEDEVDFSVLGKVKKSDLPEDLRNYPSPQEMLKQAAHARRYANKAEEKLHEAEARVAELEETARTVPELRKQLLELEKVSHSASRAIEAKPSISSGEKAELQERLKSIYKKIEGLKETEFSDAEALQGVFKDTVATLSDTLGEFKSELAKQRDLSEERYKTLESSVKNVSDETLKERQERKQKVEQKEAERGLSDLQGTHPELKTSKPLYSDDRQDVESAIVRFANRVYGRKLQSFDEVNRLVSAYNAQDKEVQRVCQEEGISPADFGITDKDVLNYGILMNIYWQQRGERINTQSGKREPVMDFRGKSVTHPDFEATFKYMKDHGGITQLEQEAAVIGAEKTGQSKLEASLNKRDTSPPTLGPTGAPVAGQAMSDEQAAEVVGINDGRLTIDQEKMEMLLRRGNQKGWDMWDALIKAHEVLKLELPKPEGHWKKPKVAQ